MTMPFVSVSKGVMNVELKDLSQLNAQLNATLKILKVGIESLDSEEVYEICPECGETNEHRENCQTENTNEN